MKTPIPTYLKLHTTEEKAPCFLVKQTPEICRNLENATGWEFQFRQRKTSEGRNPGPGSQISGMFEVIDMSDSVNRENRPTFRETAVSIADASNLLVNQIENAQRIIRELNADLATHVPVIHFAENPSAHQQMLESLLQSAAKIAGCDSAALFLLDDATANLDCRASIGISETQIGDRQRPLESSIADLEAIVGHAVVIEDASKLAHWNVPVDCRSAICLPVSTMTTPLGTLWIFGDEIRDYQTDVVNVIEIIAGRIAAELQFLSAMNQMRGASPQHDRSDQPGNAGTVSRRRPNLLPPLDEVSVSLKPVDREYANLGVTDWSFSSDGKLWLFAASVEADQNHGQDIAAALQTSFCALRNHVDSPAELVESVIDTVCRLEPETVRGQIQCALVDCENGKTEFSSAGDGDAWIDFQDFGKACQLVLHSKHQDTDAFETEFAGWRIEWR